MAKLADAELAANVRAGNVRRSERRRERLARAGKVQLVVWVNTTTKAALVDEAARRGQPIGATAAALLREALSGKPPEWLAAERLATMTGAERLAAVSVALEEIATSVEIATTPDKAELMNEVAALLASGMSGAEVARQLNDAGKRTATGAAFTSGNLLRDYRAWLKKTGAAGDTTTTGTTA